MSVFEQKRLVAGYTLSALAEKMNVSTMTVWRWQKGVIKPTTDKAIKIAALLNSTVEELFADTSENPTMPRPKKHLAQGRKKGWLAKFLG